MIDKRYVQAGDLDRKIEITKPVEVKSSTGALTKTWESNFFAWAKVEDVTASSGKEVITEEGMIHYDENFFTIRYNSNVTTKMKVLFEGGEYNILHTQEIGRRKYLIIRAKLKE